MKPVTWAACAVVHSQTSISTNDAASYTITWDPGARLRRHVATCMSCMHVCGKLYMCTGLTITTNFLTITKLTLCYTFISQKMGTRVVQIMVKRTSI